MSETQHDEAIAAMSDVGKWYDGTCECCGAPIRWRWTNLRMVAATGDETVAIKEVRLRPNEGANV